MSKPTKAQIKELWEWCGFKRLPEGKKGWHYERMVKVMNWLAPDQTEYKSKESVRNLGLIFKADEAEI